MASLRCCTAWVTRSTFVTLVAVLIASCGAPCPGWGQLAAKKMQMEDKVLVTKDGVKINITYFPSLKKKEAPVVILLHGKGGNRLVWHTGVGNIPGFAPALQLSGFAVVTVDLRGHGQNIAADGGAAPANKKSESTKLVPRDHQAMVAGDLEAVKKFLLDEHQKENLNINKLAIVGADFTTAVALAYTDLDWSKEPYDDSPVPGQGTPKGQDVHMLVLISPDKSVPGLVTQNAVARIRSLRMPVMVVVGEKDTHDKSEAKRLSESLTNKKDEKTPHVFLESLETNARGTDMLNKQLGLEQKMLKFLVDQAKNLEGEWRNRKSPLQD